MTTTQHSLLNSIILHLVFQQLPQKDLLLAQQVCKTWYDLITKSQSLQKQLFLLPDHDHAAEDEEDFHFNELLQDHFPEFFRNRIDGCDRALGPLRDTKWHRLVEPARLHKDAAETERLNDIYARPEASWRKMIPCRPAPRELQMLIAVRGRFGASGSFKKLNFERTMERPDRSLTFDLMYDIVQYFVLPSYEKRVDMRAKVEIVTPAMRVPEEGVTMLQRYAAGIGPSNEDISNEFWLRGIRAALPGHDLGGQGTVGLRLTTVRQCKRGKPADPGQEYDEDYLRSEASIVGVGKEIKWDAEQEYRVR